MTSSRTAVESKSNRSCNHGITRKQRFFTLANKRRRHYLPIPKSVAHKCARYLVQVELFRSSERRASLPPRRHVVQPGQWFSGELRPPQPAVVPAGGGRDVTQQRGSAARSNQQTPVSRWNHLVPLTVSLPAILWTVAIFYQLVEGHALTVNRAHILANTEHGKKANACYLI